jgi:hypothetical protein
VSNDWYEITDGSDLQQGDIITACPIYSAVTNGKNTVCEAQNVEFEINTFDVIVLSQTCDLVAGQEKIDHVILCALATIAVIKEDEDHDLHNKGMRKKASKNELPAFHVIEKYDGDECNREASVVHFRQIYTLPLEFLRNIAKQRGKRLRLKSPYREQLGQRFGNFFQRVAIPKAVQVE